MLAAGTIASLSFASLAAFGLPTIKSFGLCTAFGIVAALTVEMTFIPAIRVLMSPPSQDRPSARSARSTSIRSSRSWRTRSAPARNGRSCGLPGRLVLALAGLTRLKAGNTLGAQFFEGNAPVHGFRMAD